ncbi:MAG: alpha/beta hydrolase [Deltaproteobacteria bacterium]|nr:alpha/beta hydrolase [Deltaproteobacteria bacterium]
MFSVFYKHIENYFVFAPQKALDFTPSDYHMKWRDVYLDTPDGEVLHGWFFTVTQDEPVILFFHGNAGNISHRLDYIERLIRLGFNVFIIDYRGYGKSSGKPSEEGIYIDALCAYDHLVSNEKTRPENIVLLGRSLGCAAAIETATRRKARALILESGFLSVRHMARHMGIFILISPFLPENYNNLDKIKNILVPKLIIHGKDDRIVPFAMGEKLFAAADEPKYFYAIEGAGHNDTYLVGGREYMDIIGEFIRSSKVNAFK